MNRWRAEWHTFPLTQGMETRRLVGCCQQSHRGTEQGRVAQTTDGGRENGQCKRVYLLVIKPCVFQSCISSVHGLSLRSMFPGKSKALLARTPP